MMRSLMASVSGELQFVVAVGQPLDAFQGAPQTAIVRPTLGSNGGDTLLEIAAGEGRAQGLEHRRRELVAKAHFGQLDGEAFPVVAGLGTTSGAETKRETGSRAIRPSGSI